MHDRWRFLNSRSIPLIESTAVRLDRRWHRLLVAVCVVALTLTGCGKSPRVEGDSAAEAAPNTNRSETPDRASADAVTVMRPDEQGGQPPSAPPDTAAPHSTNVVTESVAVESDVTAAGPAPDSQSSPGRPTNASPDKTEPSPAEPAAASPDPKTTTAIPASSSDRSRDWPQFRGFDGQGHGAAGGLPLRWNEKKNIAWKAPIRGSGWSSPAIADGKIWLTTAIVPEKSLRLMCLDAQTGATLHDVEVFRKETLGGIHPKNSHASPTPVLVDDRCYVHFGSHGTAALNLQGEIQWKTEINYYHHHGPGGSPVIVDGAMILACDGFTKSFYDERKIAGVTDPQFVVALDAATGDVRWKSKRDGAHSYATPLVVDADGQKQVVAPGGNRVVAYEPSTGAEIWSCSYDGYSVVPRPVAGHGLVFVCTGYDVPTLLAIRVNGKGDVTKTHVAWKANQAVPLNSSPILIGDELYTISDQGVASCLDARTGKVHWRKRLGGNHSSSPLFADGKLFILDEVGTTHVLSPGTKCKILAKNLLRGKTQASLAVSGPALYLRNESHLYRIEEAVAKSTDEVDAKPVEEEFAPEVDTSPR